MRSFPSRILLWVCVGMLSSAGYAGIWTGAGGEIGQDAKNPWFFEVGTLKKSIFKYCVEIDEASFGVDRRKAETDVRNALAYWRDEFASSYQSTLQRVFIAQELFFQVACDQDPALRFQFGVLSEEQHHRLTMEMGIIPQRHVALAIRTDYDTGTLQGRGFVYVSPSDGPLAMDGESIREDAWNDEYGYTLNAVIRHELGHVFGLSHQGDHNHIMGEMFPFHAVSRTQIISIPENHVFGFGANRLQVVSSVVTDQQRRLLGLSQEAFSLGFRVFDDYAEVVEKTFSSQTGVIIGRIDFTSQPILQSRYLMHFWLPEDQGVFLDASWRSSFYPGPHAKDTKVVGQYTSVFGQSTEVLQTVFIEYGPSGVQMGGLTADGELLLDISQE